MPEAAVRPPARAIERMVRQQPERRERFAALEAVFQRLALSLWRSLRGLAGDGARVALESSAAMRFADYRDGVEAASLLAIFEVEEAGSEGLVTLDPRLADAAIELLLGGGHPADPEAAGPRAYTPADEAVARRLIRLIVREIAQAFVGADGAPVAVTTRLVRTESNPALAVIAPDDDLVAVARFEAVLRPDGNGGMLDVVLPRATFEPIGRGTQRARSGRPADGHPPTGRMSALPDVPVALHAVVDRIRVPLLEVARWEAGALIPLAADTEQPITVYCEGGESKSLGRAIFAGRLGASRGRRAVRVADVIDVPPEADETQESASA